MQEKSVHLGRNPVQKVKSRHYPVTSFAQPDPSALDPNTKGGKSETGSRDAGDRAAKQASIGKSPILNHPRQGIALLYEIAKRTSCVLIQDENFLEFRRERDAILWERKRSAGNHASP